MKHTVEWIRIPARRGGMPTMVMLHEGLGSVSHWRGFPERVAAHTGAAVFVYSRPGHGESGAPGTPRTVSYLHDEAFAVLPEVLRQAGIQRPVLLGHSDGASIALLYASRFPDDTAGLILEAPHVFVEDVTVEGVARALRAYETTDLASRLSRYHRDADALFRAWSGIWLSAEFRGWNIEAALDTIRCPVLIIQGAEDEYATRAQVDAIQARLPDAEAGILPNCRHSPHTDQPDAVLEAIARYLADLMQ